MYRLLFPNSHLEVGWILFRYGIFLEVDEKALTVFVLPEFPKARDFVSLS